MPVLWTCCHCGKTSRMPDTIDGLQGRCRWCSRNSIVQGVHVAYDESSQMSLRAIAPESDVDKKDEDSRVQFPLEDFQ